MPVPLDEYPLHQVPLSLAHVASTDRNAYDRSYFNAHNRTDELFLITGFGVYPNLGITDAFALLRRGDQQSAVHFSDALGDDRLDQRVGAYRIEVIEPLRRLRLICDDPSLGLSFDLTWEGSFIPVSYTHLDVYKRQLHPSGVRWGEPVANSTIATPEATSSKHFLPWVSDG